MREILFRGKRIDINEWIEGYYAVSPTDSKSYIYAKDYTEVDIAEDGLHVAYRLMQVIPETVGQYTGLTDKNGKKIFEGDICRMKAARLKGYGAIIFMGSAFVLCDKTHKQTRYYPLYPDGQFTVVGNIHDNPELLEVEK